jgi:4-nitrophenyl phosphatase
MIKTLSPQIKALILDLDGVLWRGETPIGNLKQIFDFIHESNLQFVLATNNSTRNIAQYQEKMNRFGVDISPDQIINSGFVTAYLLKKRFPDGGPIYIIGESGLHLTLSEAGFQHDDKHPQAVVAGMNRKITFQELAQATKLIFEGKPFYGTNPDPTFPTPEGLIPGTGALLAFIERATNTKPIIAGKPSSMMAEIALERMNVKSNEALVVGDRLDTDILSGLRANCKTALVLSGVSTIEDLDNWSDKPDLVAKDLAYLLNVPE